jgi:hypothetical protein
VKHARASFAAVSLGGLVSCHVHSSASFSFDASFGTATDSGAVAAPSTTSDLDASASPIDMGVFPDAGASLAADDGGLPEDFSIRFERTACLGTCPMYVVHVGPHGAVRFSSRLHVGDHFVDGCASKNIGDKGVATIRRAIANYSYFTLKNAYSGGPTDAPSVITSVTMGGKTKTVNHYAAAPMPGADRLRLVGIEDEIDQISGAADFANQGGALKPCTYGPPSADPL